MATDQYAGPVDFLVFAFPDGTSIAAGLSAVLDRVDAGIIEILDLECVTSNDDGLPVRLRLAEMNGVPQTQVSQLDGIESDILDNDDLARIAAELEPRHFAIAIVYEDRSLAAAAAAWTAVDGYELFSGGVDIDDLAKTIQGFDQ